MKDKIFETCTSRKEIMSAHKEAQTKQFERFGVFFAFSSEQLAEGLKKIGFEKGKHKLSAIGGGGYCFSHTLKDFKEDLDALSDAKTKALKRVCGKDEIILYALNNYECFYTGDIEDAYESELQHLGYTMAECWEVFHKYREEYQ